MSGELADMDGDRAYSELHLDAIEDFAEPLVESDRIADLEQAVMDLSELVRHIGETLSWSAAGKGLNDPPLFIRACQKRLKALHLKLNSR